MDSPSPLLNLPREIRDMISSSLIAQDQPQQPIHLNMPSGRRASMTTQTTAAISSTCKQMHSEYQLLMRKAAFTPGTKTVALIYNCDFKEMTSFIKGLRSSEVAAANRNQSLVLNLMVFGLRSANAQKLVEWCRTCEEVGIVLEYKVQWTQFDAAQVEAVDSALGRYREGRKILKGLLAARRR